MLGPKTSLAAQVCVVLPYLFGDEPAASVVRLTVRTCVTCYSTRAVGGTSCYIPASRPSSSTIVVQGEVTPKQHAPNICYTFLMQEHKLQAYLCLLADAWQQHMATLSAPRMLLLWFKGSI